MAVKIYSDLLEHTETVLTGIAADPIVYFGNESDPDRFKDYPKRLQEGDTLRLLATVHNLTEYEGDASISLKVTGAAQPFSVSKSS